MRSGEVRLHHMAIVHVDLLAVEQVVQVHSTDAVGAHIDAEFVSDVVHVLLADELVIDAETASMLEDLVEVARAHQLAMGVPVAVLRSVNIDMMVMMIVMLINKVLNDDWVAWADLEAISLHTLAQENLDGLLFTQLDAR